MKRNHLFFNIFFALAVLAAPAITWGQGWKRTFQDLSKPYAMQQTPDGGAVFVATLQGPSANLDLIVLKTDADGHQQWRKTLGGTGNEEGRSLALAPDNCIIATGIKSYSANNGDAYLVKLTLGGSLLWEKIFNFGVLDDPKCVRSTPDGGFIVALESDKQLRLLKTDAAGEEIWSNTYPQTFGQQVNHLEIISDGGFLVTLLESNLPLVAPIAHVLKTDAAGGFQFEKEFQHFSSYSTANIAKAKPANGGQILLAHRDSVYRLDAEGNLLESTRIVSPHNFFLTDIIPANNGGFWAYATEYSFATPSFSRLWFGRFGADNALVWGRNIQIPTYFHTTLAAERLSDGGFFLTGFFAKNTEFSSYLLRTDTLGQTFTNQITGAVFWDKNLDCAPSPGEPPLPGWVVKIAHPNGETYYAYTDSLGHYAAETGQGEHIVSIFPPNSLWNTLCAQDVPVEFDTTFGQANVAFPISKTADCPLAWVDVGVANWLPCEENTLAVRYANQGTAPALGATVRLAFDTLLEVVGASIPYTQTAPQEYLFPLGDLAALQNGAFDVQIVPACGGLVLGQAKCVKARIEPDAPCLSPLDGPLFVVTGQCDADSVRFRVQNVGSGPLGVLEFIIIEDDIMYAQPFDVQLGGGEQATYSYPANGSTWRFEALQGSGVPGWESEARITAVVEGCTTNGAFSTGFVNQFSLFDGGNFVETECREIVAAPDGTRKMAYPSGYDIEHFIAANTDIEYALHFENTTGDTVRLVVLRDTIETQHLDIASVLPGSASHLYSMTISGIGVVVFRFDSIVLPPSGRGWVKLRLAQHPDLPSGTVIHNRATVGLDFGAPMLTNKTFHTVTNPMLPNTSTTNQHPPRPSLLVWPLPTSSSVFLEMPQPGDYRAQVSDWSGRFLLEKEFTGQRLLLSDEELPTGVFIASVWAGNRLAGTAKIVKIR